LFFSSFAILFYPYNSQSIIMEGPEQCQIQNLKMGTQKNVLSGNQNFWIKKTVHILFNASIFILVTILLQLILNK